MMLDRKQIAKIKLSSHLNLMINNSKEQQMTMMILTGIRSRCHFSSLLTTIQYVLYCETWLTILTLLVSFIT